MTDLIHELVKRSAAGESLAVCVVTRTRGSTPQKPGAMMLVLQSGQTRGTLGGGCVEAEVRRRALELLAAGEHRLLTFRLDHDYGWDDGLVCGGTMEVAVRGVASAADASPWRDAAAALRDGRSANVAMEVRDESDQTLIVTHVVELRPMLIIAGAGHVGMALASLADGIEFDCTVIDDRADCASPARFPKARCVVGEIETELRRLPMRADTYVVIVTRGHRHDARALEAVVHSEAGYIGLIGSKRKIVTIIRSLRDAGVEERRLSRVHAPIGLEIGAVTPGEIAVSIAAELVATRRGIAVPGTMSMKLTPRQLDHALTTTVAGRPVNDA